MPERPAWFRSRPAAASHPPAAAVPSPAARFWTSLRGLAARLPLLLLVGAALYASSAFWGSLRPPLQDLPQHLATARVLLDRAHPGFHFQELFEVDWWRSQYLGTYVLLGAFYHPLRLLSDQALLWACRGLLLALALGWGLAAELAYRSLRRPAGLGLFALAFFFNAHLVLGFLNFLLGIVACLVALACLARVRARAGDGTLAHELGWSAAAFCCFYLHVVPFALLGGALGLVLLEAAWRAFRARRAGHQRQRTPLSTTSWLRLSLGFAPAAVAALAWLSTPAGVSAREAAAGSGARGQAVYASVAQNRAELEGWLDDAFTSRWDTRWAQLALGALGVWLLLELGYRLWSLRQARSPEAAPLPVARGQVAPDRPLLWLLRGYVPLCLLLYFALPSAYDWIWPINARFPLLAVLLLPFWLPAAGERVPGLLTATRAVLLGALLVAAVGHASVARAAFAGFEHENRGLDELLASLPPGSRTAALIFDRGSRYVGFAPFLHIGAYAQAERGGASVFSFADFPQSPVRFREPDRPPRLPPRWEWLPERVKDRDLSWFDYVLTRGGPGRIARSKRFEAAGRFGDYRLFRKRATPAPPSPSAP